MRAALNGRATLPLPHCSIAEREDETRRVTGNSAGAMKKPALAGQAG
jgi:hypothetical protein